MRIFAGFEGGANIGQPTVDTALTALHAFVTPMCGETVFGHLVHAFGADLHLHPFVLGTQDSGMQTLITVGLRNGHPVAQTFEVRLVAIGDQREDFPAVSDLIFGTGVENDANGKEIIHFFEATMLLLHLLPDGVNAFRASLHVVAQSGGGEHLMNRRHKILNIGVAALFRGIERLLDHIVGFVLQVFERQIL